MSCITVQLGFSDTQLNSCKGYYQSSTVYYTDFLNFAQATKIYINSTCTTYAPQGYYSNGVITRYWDPVLKKLLKSTSCQLPMVFNPCCDGLDKLTFLVSNASFIDPILGAYYMVSFSGVCYQYSNVLSNLSPVATFTNYQYKDCQTCLQTYPCNITPTPTPTQTPTPSTQPTSIYLRSCCDGTYYYSLGNILRTIGDVITIKPYNYCYTVVFDNGTFPANIPSLNDYQWEKVTSCADIKCQPCSPQPSSSVPYTQPGQTDPCSYSTILPLGVECNVTQPLLGQPFTGILDLEISGGTPPYYVEWSPGGIGKTIYNQGPGVYTATVTDIWKDFTVTTICVLEEELNCGFVPNATEYFIPTPTPTVTPTVTTTPTPTPSITPTMTVTPTNTMTVTPTPSITPSSVGPIVPLCSVLYVSPSTEIYSYDVTANTKTLLSVPSNTNTYDIAHTQNKLWTISTTNILEWNITLNPFSATLNRSLTPPFNLSPGLGAINNTSLIVGDNSTPQKLYELNITTNTPVATLKITLPVSHEVAGDVLLTTTNKLLVTTINNSLFDYHLLQYNYATGVLELDVTINTVYAPYGLFQNNGNIYVVDSGGNVYTVNTVSPYNTTYIQNLVGNVNGASQVPSCLTNELIIPTCRCYSITNTNIYNTLSFKYYNCDGVLINKTIPPNSYGKFCGNGVTSVGQGTLVGDCDVNCEGTYPNI